MCSLKLITYRNTIIIIIIDYLYCYYNSWQFASENPYGYSMCCLRTYCASFSSIFYLYTESVYFILLCNMSNKILPYHTIPYVVRLHQDCFKETENCLQQQFAPRFMRLPWRNSASEMFVNLNIYSFDDMLRIFTFGFMSRVSVSNNQFISSIYNSPCRLYSNIWTWWDNLLHINRVNL